MVRNWIRFPTAESLWTAA